MAKKRTEEIKSFQPKYPCGNCEQEKPCSWHGFRKTYLCSDCWNKPPVDKRKFREITPRQLAKKKQTLGSLAPARYIPPPTHPDIIGPTVPSVREPQPETFFKPMGRKAGKKKSPPPPHPDAR